MADRSPREGPGPNPDADTRRRLLDAAFEDIYVNGFQGLRVDRLVQTTGVTKGAFYHYFPSKTALGMAVIDERIAPLAEEVWCTYLAGFEDPLAGILGSVGMMVEQLGARCYTNGCPINNLAQEMSPLDDQFRMRLEGIFDQVRQCIAMALHKGQRAGIVAPSVDTKMSAVFILAVIEGAIGLAKNAQAAALFDAATKELERYLEGLRV
ncbi:MAG: TetR/AcrR family transcriptional regulator [Parvularcula sp.]